MSGRRAPARVPTRRRSRATAVCATLALLAALMVVPARAASGLCVDLLAGQDIPVGEVCVGNDTAELSVTYTTTGGWQIAATHLHVATDLAGVPQTPRGSPTPGRFAHTADHDPPTTETAYAIPLAAVGAGIGSEVVVAAQARVELHGDVVQAEGAWGAGTRFVEVGNWATWFAYEIADRPPDPDPDPPDPDPDPPDPDPDPPDPDPDPPDPDTCPPSRAPEPDATALTATAAPLTAGAAATTVPISAIPPEAIPLRTGAVEATPLRSIDLAATPLRSIPLRSIPLRSIPLRSILLSAVELHLPGGWPALLAGTPLDGLPLQTVTLADVAELDPSPLDDLDLGDLGLASTPLRSIGLASIVLGATPLRSIPLDADSDDHLADWRALLDGLGFADLVIGPDTTLLAIDVAGVPLRSIPLRSIPLRSIDLEAAPLRSIPLRSITIAATPLRSIPLRSIGGLAELVDCSLVDCDTATLGEAEAAGALRDGATLGALVDGLGERTLAELGLDHEPTLGDVLLGILDRADYPWEDLPLEQMGVAEFAGTGESVDYRVGFTVAGVPGEGAALSITLAGGFRYLAGTSCATATTGDGTVGAGLGEPAVHGSELRWPLPDLPAGATVQLQLTAGTGLAAGEHTATARLDLGATGDLESADAPAVEVTPNFDPENNDAETAPVLGHDTLYLGHIAAPGDVDYYRIPAPPAGARLSVFLSQQASDNDLFLYSPQTAPLRSIPLRSIPLRSIPLDDEGLGFDAPNRTLAAEGLHDLPIADLPLRALSTRPGTADEEIEVTTAGADGHYVVQVAGYNEAHSAQPYVLRVRISDPPPERECAPLDPPQAAPGTLPAGAVPPGTQALFLVNEQRLLDAAGSSEAAEAVVPRLEEFAARDDVNGAVVTVDAHAPVRAAYAAWDANPCSAAAANDVVREVAGLVDEVRERSPDLRFVVLVGSDAVVPLARIPDLTRLANEREYAPEVGEANALSESLRSEHFLSDDPYGDTEPIAWFDRALHVPELAVGRLVETPEEILLALDTYEEFDGRLDPSTALVTGYDFLADASDEIADVFADRFGAGAVDRLIDDTWTRAQLEELLVPTDPEATPHLAAVNAHFDHHRLLPALGDATRDISDLFTVEHLGDDEGRFAGRLLFSMGCHGGLNVPEAQVGGAAPTLDWAQALAQRQAILVANTGYGYGDTAAVALSERLMLEFAERLDGSVAVGEALAFAKQAYFGRLGVYGVYDEKVMLEATLYGLPMYRIGDGEDPFGAAAHAAGAVAADVQVESVTLTPTFEAVTAADGTRHYTVGGDAQVTHYRPIQPRTVADLEGFAGQTPRGAFFTALETADEDDFAVTFARPVIDLSANEPALPAGDVAFPAANLTTTLFHTADGPQDRLVVIAGQFLSDDAPDSPPGVGRQRLLTHVEADVFFSASADVTPPLIRRVEATTDGAVTTWRVRVSDDDSGVAQVVVGYRRVDGTWAFADLSLDADDEWTATVDVPDALDFFVQARDAAGNVAVSTNKGELFTPEELVIEPPEVDDRLLFSRIEWSDSPPFAAYDVYLREADGTIVQLTDALADPEAGEFGVYGYSSPSWSADGTRFAATKFEGSSVFVAVVTLDGTEVWKVGDAYRPAWSPDGELIAFVGAAGLGEGVWTARADGTDLARRSDTFVTSVSWSPDGSQLAYVEAQGDGEDRVVVISNLDGSGRRTIPGPPGGQPWEVAWSPDGTQLAVSIEARWPVAIALVDADGEGDWTTLISSETVPNAHVVEHPSWRADGLVLAFTMVVLGEDETEAVYRVNRDGSEVTRLEANGFSPAYRWPGG